MSKVVFFFFALLPSWMTHTSRQSHACLPYKRNNLCSAGYLSLVILPRENKRIVCLIFFCFSVFINRGASILLLFLISVFKATSSAISHERNATPTRVATPQYSLVLFGWEKLYASKLSSQEHSTVSLSGPKFVLLFLESWATVWTKLPHIVL